ncbi:restriction endonuclease subunit S [Enterococcus cecorum]|uniref:restriction endonuclease subunit S n=1 Tax=Enterococcus cecorum TaxID=44008 RepID=UPI001FADE3F1|nr:restriction endonuclease subunit S [Enterococcus cecorum]MCJ0537457.1 restriction endonuclease subunit S [Enterococcus cecorum]MCJ0550800.1 restriction endonuclease subunit S [Enterococcus cecorum]MCJ0568336.1 restriction endonuclease subunit S [Enterococcus cecorum]
MADKFGFVGEKEKPLIKISDVVFFQEGPGVRNTQYTTKGVKLLNVANLVDGKIDLSTSNRYISEEEAYGKYNHFLCEAGDFVVASSGIKVEYIDKKMGFIEESMLPLCMNTSTIRFKVLDKNQLDIRYFMYYLKSRLFKEQLARHITGSAQLNYGPSHLKKMTMPLIALEKQKEMVAVLDKIQIIISNFQQQLSELDTLIKARFVEMFGDPVSNSYRCHEATLMELGELGRGVSKHRPRNDSKLLGGKYPLIQTGDVANSGLYITSYNSTYSELGLKQSKMWNKGTLCITIAANIAKTAILEFDACFPDSIVGFIAGEQTNNIFIHYWFSFFQKIIETQAPESAQKNINLKILSELKVIVPEKEKQNEFAAFVQQIDKLRVVIQKSLDEAQYLFDSLMQEYFG